MSLDDGIRFTLAHLAEEDEDLFDSTMNEIEDAIDEVLTAFDVDVLEFEPHDSEDGEAYVMSHLMHEYDAAKRREYYLKTRKLKGRRKGVVDTKGGRQARSMQDTLAAQRAKAEARRKAQKARIAKFKAKLARLQEVYKKLLEAAKKRSGAETKPEPKKSSSTSKAPEKKLTTSQKKEAAERAKEAQEKEKKPSQKESPAQELKALQEKVATMEKKIAEAIAKARAAQKNKPAKSKTADKAVVNR